ncbi:MAG: phage virion morphogenesis protein [Pseudomonadota bacterium]
MSGASFAMDTKGLSRMTKQAVTHLQNTQLLAETIGEQLVSSTIERFENEEGPDGEAWEKSGRAEEEGGQTLTDKGQLKASVHYEASPAMVAVGSNDIRYAIHQFGGEITPKSAKKLVFEIGGKKVFAKKVTMPARPTIGINEEDIEESRATIALFMKKGFGIK